MILPFEDAVRKALEDRGWTVHPQVGVAGFRVDLGVVHPDAPGRYLAGVECDGATYHRLATARDRDLLRERILRNLGWEIFRVWSTDWWVDAERALATLHANLTEALELDRESRKRANDEEHPGVPSVIESEIASTNSVVSVDEELMDQIETEDDPLLKGTPRPERTPVYAERSRIVVTTAVKNELTYQRADLVAAGFNLDRDAFYDPAYRTTLRRMIAHIISVEGPNIR